MTALPEQVRWLFWEADFDRLERERDADYVIGRIVESGRFEDVRWLIDAYGLPRIHEFFRDVGHTEISERTIRFWRALLGAREELWREPPAWRRNSSAPWVS